ncbi:uncharacterized, partial [Tachysurus ichikawai]
CEEHVTRQRCARYSGLVIEALTEVWK